MCLRKTTTHLASLQPIFAQSSLPIAEYVISKESFVASYYWTEPNFYMPRSCADLVAKILHFSRGIKDISIS